ncbi:hypothetical protein ABZW11_14220 [Nonomuraea sp. NPDC004580]|uniref:hypothetical protein n=1 Tax=Nonomuraea sp. NPDC004580 TaxID=3154552 RepID=UPI0033ACB40D
MTLLSDPGPLDRRVPANPTTASAAAGWSLFGLAVAALAVASLEPDPDVTWDEARLAALAGPGLTRGRTERGF